MSEHDFTEGQLAIINQTAWAVIEAALPRLNEAVDLKIARHRIGCGRRRLAIAGAVVGSLATLCGDMALHVVLRH